MIFYVERFLGELLGKRARGSNSFNRRLLVKYSPQIVLMLA